MTLSWNQPEKLWWPRIRIALPVPVSRSRYNGHSLNKGVYGSLPKETPTLHQTSLQFFEIYFLTFEGDVVANWLLRIEYDLIMGP